MRRRQVRDLVRHCVGADTNVRNVDHKFVKQTKHKGRRFCKIMSEDMGSPQKRQKQNALCIGADRERRPPTEISDARGRLNAYLDPEKRECNELVNRGYTVVTIMSAEEADRHASLVWGDLEALDTGIKRDDPTTWKDGWPQTSHGALLLKMLLQLHAPPTPPTLEPPGLIQNQGSGLWYSICAARCTTEPFFRRFFNGSKVISSWDAFALCKPDYQKYCYSQGPDKAVPEVAGWLHTDQAKAKSDLLHHVQGALALTDLVPGIQRTQLVVPRNGETAQQFRDRFLSKFPPPKEKPQKGKYDAEREEWIKHTTEEKQWLVDNGQVVMPVVKKGQMLLWASGIPHASLVDEMPEGMDKRHPRISVFISMVPRELLSQNEIHFRRKLLDKGVTSGHRVCEVGAREGSFRQCVFGRSGQTYGAKLPEYKLDIVQTDFSRYYKMQRSDPRVDEISPSAVHRATARICGGYHV
jgi:hypothetical protein